MEGRSSVTQLVFVLVMVILTGMLGCKQDPDNVYITDNSNQNVFHDLYITATADCLFVPGVEIPLRAIAVYGNSGYGYAEQNWTNRVTWSVPDSGFGTITPGGVLKTKRTGVGEVLAVSPEGWYGQRSLTIQTVHAVTVTVDDPVVFRDDTTHVTVAVQLTNGNTQTVPPRLAVDWQVSDASVIQFFGTRGISGMNTGYTTIAAKVGDIVSEPVVLTVDSVLTVACHEESVGPYFPMDTVRFSATATTSLAGRMSVDARAEWESSNPARLTYISDGVFVPVAPGTFTVHSTLGGVTSPEASVAVWNVTSLEISPPVVSDTLYRGDTLFFTATGNVEGYGQLDLTQYATWISTEGMAGTFVAPGVFVANTAGTTNVWARIGSTATQTVPVLVARMPLLYETFETLPYGNFAGGVNTNWTVNTYSPGRVVISTLAAGGSKSCMFVDSTYSGYAYMDTRTNLFSALTQGVLEADLRTEGDGLYLQFESSGGYQMGRIEFQSGNINAYTYTGYTMLQTFTPNRWYHISMDFDCSAGTYGVTIDGVRRMSDMRFYYSSSAVYAISVGTSSSYTGNRSYVDNIMLTE